MNKKQKLVARKHRKNKERIKSLKQASVAIASKKSRELVTKMQEKVQKVSDKKTTAKKPAAKKPAAKKPAAKKPAAKKPAAKKPAAKKPEAKKKTTAKKSSKADK